MSKLAKITEDDVRNCLAEGVTVQDIALKYDVATSTVLKIKSIVERKDRKESGVQDDEQTARKRKNLLRNANLTEAELSKPFDLEIGDIITAYEEEVSKKKNTYKIVSIQDKTYTAEKIIGGRWKVTFLKNDYMKRHDPYGVRLVSRRKDEVEQQ